MVSGLATLKSIEPPTPGKIPNYPAGKGGTQANFYLTTFSQWREFKTHCMNRVATMRERDATNNSQIFQISLHLKFYIPFKNPTPSHQIKRDEKINDFVFFKVKKT